MSNSNGSSTVITKVIIPNNVKKTIKNIKEITKNHTEFDIYEMLKECSMDPNETTQRLLDLDTFHQVKSKRDKRKEVVKSRQGEDSWWKHRHPTQWPRGGRGNTFSQYSSNDAGGRRGNFTRKENGVEDMRANGFRKPTASILKKIDTVQPPHVEKTLSISTKEPVKMTNGNLGGPHSKPDRVDGRCSKESVEQISKEATAHIPVNNDVSFSAWMVHSDLQDVDGVTTSSSMVEQEAVKPATATQPNGLREFPADDKHRVPTSISGITPSTVQGADPLAGTEEAAPKLVKSKFFDGQHVIIPDHLQVPDAVKDVLSFGSINAGFSVGRNYVKIDNSKDLHSNGDTTADEATKNASSCYIDQISDDTQVNHTDNQPSQSHLHNDNYTVDSKPSLPASNGYQLQEDNNPTVGPPYSIVQTAPNYRFGFVPPMLANTLVQPDRYEYQAHFPSSLSGDSSAVLTLSSTPPVTQSSGVGQTLSSATVSPQTIPLFHHPYQNYIPYNHYFSPLYLPPTTMHQFYGHTAFPTPLPSSNVFQSTPLSATSMNSFPQHIQSEANGRNQAPAGVLSGYGAYNSSQSEGAGVWIPTAIQDTTRFPVNSSLNIPQGQHVIYSMQPMSTLATGHPLPQQSQLMTINSAGQYQQTCQASNNR